MYFTAALGVILDQGSNTQKFFGGGEADNERRDAKNNVDSHNDDVTALALSGDRTFACTGQRGPSPAIFTWDANTGEKKNRVQLARGARGIAACAISADDKYFAVVDMSNDHVVSVFDANSGNQCFSQKGDQNWIYDCAFTQKPGDYTLMTTGKNHACFWEFQSNQKKKGLHGKFGISSHQVCCWDAEGVAYSGDYDGRVFAWKDREAVEAKDAHRGKVTAIRCVGDKVFSGGRDGCL